MASYNGLLCDYCVLAAKSQLRQLTIFDQHISITFPLLNHLEKCLADEMLSYS